MEADRPSYWYASPYRHLSFCACSGCPLLSQVTFGLGIPSTLHITSIVSFTMTSRLVISSENAIEGGTIKTEDFIVGILCMVCIYLSTPLLRVYAYFGSHQVLDMQLRTMGSASSRNILQLIDEWNGMGHQVSYRLPQPLCLLYAVCRIKVEPWFR